MSDYLQRLLTFYWNPRRAASETLDHSHLAPVIILAVVVALVLQAPGYYKRQALSAELASFSAELVRAQPAVAGQEVDYKKLAPVIKKSAEITKAMEATYMPGDFRELAVLAGLFVPGAIALIVIWQGLGRCSMMVGREYAPVLLCIVSSWTAARLPLIPFAYLPAGTVVQWASYASTAVFLILACISLRTCLGSSWMPAGVAAGLGAGALAAGGLVTTAVSPMLWVLASPCLLYYARGQLGAGFSSIGASLSAKQSLKRALEATTLNPRDADAHFQLGLIQLQRHNLTEAEARFRRAAEIDPSDADYAYRLGCVLRSRGQLAESLEWLERAARLNARTAGSEVWREIGATQLGLGGFQESLAALDRYLNDREYDPVGLTYHGEALLGLGRRGEAKASFEKALEAIRTMPRHRRGELRPWAGRAKEGLRR
ncbi:MAG TPA: tetratricopeptide repeat protein [Bryobacteraceae bacterium]|nr:tetratricopeptide repeat protein [Bryobacteraceae bacterium]